MKAAALVVFGVFLVAGTAAAGELRGHLETEDLAAHLRDRGEGVPLSMFGTYIQKGQRMIYPFFEYYHSSKFEYAPNELGLTDGQDYRGDYRATEALLFFAYGVTDRLAIEGEAAIIQAQLKTSPSDLSGLPDEIRESGLGDVEGQLRWRWTAEATSHPEVFSYFETVGPTQKAGSLIGTSDWEFKLGTGVIRGFSWGTMTARGSVQYALDGSVFDMGEMAVEYLKRLSPAWRIYAGVEGVQDEVGFIAEAQWHISRGAILKLNNAFGLTSKSSDWAPEIGVLFSF